MQLRKRNMQYTSAKLTEEFDFDIVIKTQPFGMRLLWSDQSLTPRLKVTLLNKGQELDNGEMTIEIVEHRDLATFPSRIDGFKDVKHFRILNLKAGDKRNFRITIEDKFLMPGQYMLRITIFRGVPAKSLAEDLDDQLQMIREQKPNFDIVDMKTKAIQAIKDFGQDPYRERPNQFRGQQLLDWRWLDVIKVHQFWTVFAPLLSAVIVLVTSIALLIVNGV